ncbi:MAG: hypothetical protein HOW97_23365 [Catenulispora sp.]|nr:hypothetical protein [Catenulispora sp.]
MSIDDPRDWPEGLTDDQLDAWLDVADDDLLRYAEATIDPTRLLTTLLDGRSAPPALPHLDNPQLHFRIYPLALSGGEEEEEEE